MNRQKQQQETQPAIDSSSPLKTIECRNPDNPWPDNPKIPGLIPDDPTEELVQDGDYRQNFELPSEADIDEEHADTPAPAPVSEGCAIHRRSRTVEPGGATVPPVPPEPHRDSPRVRRSGSCHLDLAIWMTRLDWLKDLRKAIKRGLRPVQETPYGGIAHHQLDVHLFDVQLNRYRGRLCIFGECPKPGKRECYVPNCGAQPFL